MNQFSSRQKDFSSNFAESIQESREHNKLTIRKAKTEGILMQKRINKVFVNKIDLKDFSNLSSDIVSGYLRPKSLGELTELISNYPDSREIRMFVVYNLCLYIKGIKEDQSDKFEEEIEEYSLLFDCLIKDFILNHKNDLKYSCNFTDLLISLTKRSNTICKIILCDYILKPLLLIMREINNKNLLENVFYIVGNTIQCSGEEIQINPGILDLIAELTNRTVRAFPINETIIETVLWVNNVLVHLSSTTNSNLIQIILQSGLFVLGKLTENISLQLDETIIECLQVIASVFHLHGSRELYMICVGLLTQIDIIVEYAIVKSKFKMITVCLTLHKVLISFNSLDFLDYIARYSNIIVSFSNKASNDEIMISTVNTCAFLLDFEYSSDQIISLIKIYKDTLISFVRSIVALFKIKKTKSIIAAIVSCLCTLSNKAYFLFLFNSYVLETLIEVLYCTMDSQILIEDLKCLFNVLESTRREAENSLPGFLQIIEKCSGYDKLKSFAYSKFPEIVRYSKVILAKYYPDENKMIMDFDSS